MTIKQHEIAVVWGIVERVEKGMSTEQLLVRVGEITESSVSEIVDALQMQPEHDGKEAATIAQCADETEFERAKAYAIAQGFEWFLPGQSRYARAIINRMNMHKMLALNNAAPLVLAAVVSDTSVDVFLGTDTRSFTNPRAWQRNYSALAKHYGIEVGKWDS